MEVSWRSVRVSVSSADKWFLSRKVRKEYCSATSWSESTKVKVERGAVAMSTLMFTTPGSPLTKAEPLP